MPRWVGLKEASEALKVHPRTVQRMVDRGELRGRHVGKRLEVELHDDAIAQNVTPLQSDTQAQNAPERDMARQVAALRAQLANTTGERDRLLAERDRAEQQSSAYWQELVKLHDTLREINANMARMQHRLEAAEQRLALPAPDQERVTQPPPAQTHVTHGTPPAPSRRRPPRTVWERLFGRRR
jgi:excisionase family DNA binding protein